MRTINCLIEMYDMSSGVVRVMLYEENSDFATMSVPSKYHGLICNLMRDVADAVITLDENGDVVTIERGE